MINTKTGKVCVYDQSVIDDMPWYQAVVESQQETVQEEPTVAEKPKRKTWKDAVAEKAKTLEESSDESIER